MSVEDWRAVIDTNLNSMFNVTRQVIDGMLEKGWGRIINISSVNGQKGQFGQTNYSTAKAGLHGFTMALAQEVASKGITVNTVSPGYIATDMVKAIRQRWPAHVLMAGGPPDSPPAGAPTKQVSCRKRRQPIQQWSTRWPPRPG